MILAFLATISFIEWLFWPNKWTKWIMAFFVPLFLVATAFTLNSYITYNEGVTDRLFEIVNELGLKHT